jgi:hypothetical protein
VNERNRWQRWTLAVVLAIVVLGPGVWAVMQRVPNRIDRALADDGAGHASVAVEIVASEGPEVHTLSRLWRSGTGDLAPAEFVSLLIETFGTTPTIESARLQVGTCIFTLPAPVAATGGMLLTMHRDAVCADFSATAELHVTLSGSGRLGLWTWYRPVTAPRDHEGLTLTAPEGASPVDAVIRGRYGWTQTTDGERRLPLVAWMWGAGRAQVMVAAAAIAGAIVVGIVLLMGAGAWRQPAGLGLCALGLAACWAVIVPPLQGADEPDHLLSFGEVVGAADVPAQLETLARATHFERLRFRSLERFTPADRYQPNPVAWTGDIHSERMEHRSPLTQHLWRIAAGLGADRLDLPGLILALRLFDALVFAVAVAAAGALLRATSISGTAWSLCGLALIPTVPYFAVMVSDWAYVVSGAVLVAAALVTMIQDGRRAGWAGIALGLGLAVLVSTSIASLALGPLVILLVTGRILLGDHASAERYQPLIFWAGLGAGLLLGYALAGDLFQLGFRRYDAVSGSKAVFLSQVNAAVGWLASAPWLVLPALPLFVLVERLIFVHLRHTAVARTAGWVAVALAGAGALALLAVLPLSLTWQMPTIALLDPVAYPDARSYVEAALRAVSTITRLEGFDHLTFVSLWSGFGWIDTILPSQVLAGLAAAIAVACAGAVAADLHAGAPRRQGWRLIIWVGALGSVAAVAAATFMMGRNIHGRYLIAVMVPLLAASTAGAFEWLATRALAARIALALALAALHGYCLAFVLTRYF